MSLPLQAMPPVRLPGVCARSAMAFKHSTRTPPASQHQHRYHVTHPTSDQQSAHLYIIARIVPPVTQVRHKSRTHSALLLAPAVRRSGADTAGDTLDILYTCMQAHSTPISCCIHVYTNTPHL